MQSTSPYGTAGPLPWYLAQFKPNCQAIAERNLRRQDFEVFLPQQSVTRRQRGRFQQVQRPLFPGYLFVAFDPISGAWRKINATHGITRLVSFGGQPAPVPSGIIAELRARCDPSGLLQPQTNLKVGDRVRLTEGPFADFVARIEQIEPERRVWILLEVMGRPTRLEVEARAVQAA